MVTVGYIIIGVSVIWLIIGMKYTDSTEVVMISFVVAFALGLLLVDYEGLNKVIQARKQERIKQGGYYFNQCKLLEVNVDNGFFSSATNKLNCDGTIVNINKSDYDDLVSKYKASAEK
ncbi:TPA: hypothetical protein RG419_003136 [Morganella morganii]|nr:hypothetical protein [Morganella morganii]